MLHRHIHNSDGPLEHAIQTLVLLTDTASGMSHLHAHFLIHRDLAARNVLVESRSQRAMVSDFGLSRKILPEDSHGRKRELLHEMDMDNIYFRFSYN